MTESAKLIVELPGTLATVQDLGRPHLQAAGCPVGGAVDRLALRLANLLVGNDENAAAIEAALVGPVVHFTDDVQVALTGARMDGVPFAETFRVAANQRLDLSRFSYGAWGYLAVAGGIDVPKVLGGRGTDLRLGVGGHSGRALRSGDVLSIHRRSRTRAARVGRFGDALDAIRVLDGKDAGLVDPSWLDFTFRVSSTSDRVGMRLHGSAVPCVPPADAPSCPVFVGTIQLPSNGDPIVLLADAQTLGGYPQIAHVVQADLSRLVQRRPGEIVRFRRVSLAEAHGAARRLERQLGLVRYGLSLSMPRQ